MSVTTKIPEEQRARGGDDGAREVVSIKRVGRSSQ
jgi:hypothetical protein